ncbi:MAG: class I SAM-dependent methyltransferase [Anaplasma ovis]|uniref:Ubiquinone/menaquinone biosynthesis C-methyltransferase UbiE n=1 Tax=Anaplasma ovis str. Haibei TaxID=1248439 RepID=A0A2Z2LGP7_9RICK|nr:class I SAM-dependent methyltransferase [Anaplasma ovis]ASI47894.1 bifunctional demethylmenaquinone methyltransferase/2-methoxy-6-polyprenyl-1,4-benzoquinol methylase [Anaplasma ovis str. Haibei]
MPLQLEVNEVFSSVAPRYDLMNDLMSFGLHRLWKQELCGKVIRRDGALLDVAGGTGDIAMRALTRRSGLHVTVCDINPDMLEVGRDRAINSGHTNINWVCASAESLPFTHNSFDYYTIAFGMRNIPDRKKALQEAHRVLKLHGRFLCLEFSPIQRQGLFRTLYGLYSDYVIPNMGRFVAGNVEAYTYLTDSIRAFPAPEEFAQEIASAGFFNVAYQNICNGVTSLYSAWKVD